MNEQTAAEAPAAKTGGGAAQTAARTGGFATLIDYVGTQLWGLMPEMMEKCSEVLNRRIAGVSLTAEEIEAITSSREGSDREYEITLDGTAIIPVSGIIAKYSHMVNGSSQPRGTSVEKISAQLNDAMNNPRVRAILLYVESPGGSISGIADLGDRIYDAGMKKPTVAFIDDVGASAAYWLASQANSVYANQTAHVGSIGVYAVLIDSSERAKQLGLTFHIFRSGQNKGVGEPGIAITEENRLSIQENIQASYEVFLSKVLRARESLDEDGLRKLADGRTFIGARAVELRLVDGIATLEQVLQMPMPKIRTENKFRSEQMANEEKEKQEAQICQQERERIAAIDEALKDESLSAVRAAAVREGLSLEQAKARAFDDVVKTSAEKIKGLEAVIAEQQKRLEAIAKGGEQIPSQQPVDAGQANTVASDDEKAETYQKAVDEIIASGKSAAEAHRRATEKFPKSKEKWIERNKVK